MLAISPTFLSHPFQLSCPQFRSEAKCSWTRHTQEENLTFLPAMGQEAARALPASGPKRGSLMAPSPWGVFLLWLVVTSGRGALRGAVAAAA